jgi:predicted lipoprotein
MNRMVGDGELESLMMIDRRFACFGVLLAMALPLAGCKIVPIGQEQADEKARGFDATSYAAELWTKQALPHFSANAKPAAEVIPAIMADFAGAGDKFGYRPGEGSPWSFIVTGTGTVTTKNTESRAGTLVLALDGAVAPLEATLQIGPVIRGNAVRDALPFVSFKDFTNQIEYADAGKALTALAVEGIAADVAGLAVGDHVEFTGAISMAGASDKLLVTPVALKKAAP